MTPPRSSLSAGVSGAALNPTKAKNGDSGTGDNNNPDSVEDNLRTELIVIEAWFRGY